MEVIVRIERFMNNTDRPLITNVRLTLIAIPSYLEDQEDQLEQGRVRNRETRLEKIFFREMGTYW